MMHDASSFTTSKLQRTMVIIQEIPKSAIKAKKKRIPSYLENAMNSPKTMNSPVHEENMYDGSGGDYSFMSKLKQNFNSCNPMINYAIGLGGNEGKLGKKLSTVEARALSEYGSYLSEKNGDHEGAIVTLMRALKSQTYSNGALNPDCAVTLTYMGNVYMRRADASSGDEAMKDAKRAEFCFTQALEVYRNYTDKKSVTRLMRRVNASKRLQNRNRRMISFGGIPSVKTISSSSVSESSDCHDKTVISDITWMENYSSEYYRKQYLIFLKKEQSRPGIYNLFEGGMCSYFCIRPPVSNIEFVEKRLDM